MQGAIRALKSRTMRTLIALSLLGLVLIVAGIAAAQSELHSVTLTTDQSFDWRVSGYIEFKAVSDGTIRTGAGSISVKEGDTVRIVVNAVNAGNILIKSGNGLVNIKNLPVEAIYVNGGLAASNTVIDSTNNLRCDVSSFNSTLRLEVTLKQGESSGQASLTVDGQNLVKSNSYSGYIIVYGVTTPSSRDLNLNIGGNYLDGAASGVEFVDSSGSVQIIGVPEAEIWGLAAATPIVAAFVLHGRKYIQLKG